MQLQIIIATLLGIASASAVRRATCVFSPVEKAALDNGFDVNTGKFKLGLFAISTGIIIPGSKCSPAWAVGGSITDSTPTVYTGNAQPLSSDELNKKLGGFGLTNAPGSTVDIASLIGKFGGKLGGA